MFKVNENTGIELQEWKGFYSLAACREYKDKVQLDWAYPSIYNKEGKQEISMKSRPVQVKLGNKETAIKTLEAVLSELR